MRIKKYTSKSMKEALLQIRQDLGEDAVILRTARVPGKLFSQSEIEVTAAIDEDAAGPRQSFAPLRVTGTGVYKKPKSPITPTEEPARPAVEKTSRPEVPSAIEALAALARKTPSDRRRITPNAVSSQPTGDDTNKYNEIKADIRELKALFSSVAKAGNRDTGGGFSGEWAILFNRLLEAEVPADAARIRGANASPIFGAGRRYCKTVCCGTHVLLPAFFNLKATRFTTGRCHVCRPYGHGKNHHACQTCGIPCS